MGYLIPSDYKRQIQNDQLSQVVGQDISVQRAAELAAQEEVTSYLDQKYDLAGEFKDLFNYDITLAYKAGDRVYDNLGSIYNAIYPQPIFNFLSVYKKGDKAYWKDKVYTCVIPTLVISHESQLQQDPMHSQFYNSSLGQQVKNYAPDDPMAGAAYWGIGAAYQIEANTPLTDNNYWSTGDNRSQQLVMFMIDITLYHLHSRISPRNIPELRVKRYDEAIAWLKKAGKGEVTANLKVKQVNPVGNRIRFGGNTKMNNRY
jgi:hypothetical protein